MIEHRFHKSSFRPPLVMGAERKPMLFLLLVCVALGFTSVNLVALGIAAVLWVSLHPLLVWMGHVDPQMVAVYFRSQLYPGFVPAFTTPFRKGVGYRIPAETKSWHFWKR